MVNSRQKDSRHGPSTVIMDRLSAQMQARMDGLDRRWLDADGRIRLLPASEFRSVPWDDLRAWLHLSARYALPTEELVAFLRGRIAGRTAIEIGAGNGDLGFHLGIPMTDSCVQADPPFREWYLEMGQVPTMPGPGVEPIDAHRAVDGHRPQVVIGSWITRRFITGRDVEGIAQANVFGPFEEDLLDAPSVETYIHVGARHVHGAKTLLSRPHEKVALPGLVSRARPGLDVIYVWETAPASVRLLRPPQEPSIMRDTAFPPAPTALIPVEEYSHGDEPAGAYALGTYPAGEFLQAVFWHLRDENRWDPAAAFEIMDGIEERHVQRGFWRRETATDGGEPKLATCLPTDDGSEAVTFLDWGDAWS